MNEIVREMTREELVAFNNELRAENEKLKAELQEARLAIKAHAFDEIDDLIGGVWEYGDDKKVATHTLFEINGAIHMAKKVLNVIAQAKVGETDG